MAIALGIVAFALLSLAALVPLGMQINQISGEETRATQLLTKLEADLRNTHPLLNGGKSQLFHLELPYRIDGTRVVLNTGVELNAISPEYSAGVSGDEETIGGGAVAACRFQVFVLYTQKPASGEHAPIQARLVVLWPARSAVTVGELAKPPSTGGIVDTFVTFSPP